jgi:ABC-type transport system involved in Fe-S cluster assembly fused permease/ATPase subunit
MRFIEATNGRVLLDGIDVRDVTLQSQRRRVGAVSQDVAVMDASLIEIRSGRLDAALHATTTLIAITHRLGHARRAGACARMFELEAGHAAA